MAAPVVSSVTPASYPLGATGVNVTISGQNFTSDAQVTFSYGVNVRSTRFGSSTTLNAVIDVTAPTPGWGDISVTTGEGSGNLPNAYQLTGPTDPGP